MVFEREADGASDLLWMNPELPLPDRWAAFPLRVELLCWFANLDKTNAGLAVLHAYFRADSVLAAIWRRDDSTRILVYTAAREPIVQERYLGVRAVLRPTAIGLRVEADLAWDALAAWRNRVRQGGAMSAPR